MIDTQQPLALRPHILVVDDDERLRGLLRRYLSEQGYVVTTAGNAANARAKLQTLDCDLMVLDIMMPGENGLDLTRSLRETSKDKSPRQLPILLLTARGEADDRIEGFELGADDYLLKPFEPRELLLRINAILRRVRKTMPAQQTTLVFGPWRYDPSRDELRNGGSVIRLSGMEANLMRLLAAEPGIALSRETLAERGKGEINERTIDVQVTRLRRKIESDPKNPRYLVTMRGEGYMLLPESP
ncbi:MAG: response regulator transcription factor [Bdellovibrionales bacterium]